MKSVLAISPYKEPERLLNLGYKLCELKPMQKVPEGDNWQLNPVTKINPSAGGYGILLAANNLCSIDPDNLNLAREGMSRCGFDLDDVMSYGVRTTSTRPGSGGRSTFLSPEGGRWIRFSDKTNGTILEIRAKSTNLQDCLPGTCYMSKDGQTQYRQDYASHKRMEDATQMPAGLLEWYLRLSTDDDYLREQQSLFCGQGAQLEVSSRSGKLAFSSPLRADYNTNNSAVDILRKYRYKQDSRGRLAPHTATGAPSVRPVPGKNGLWQSDHASDPLHGTFDAWTAFVVLEHDSDLAAAESAWQTVRQSAILADFPEVPLDTEMSKALPPFRRDKKGEILATKNNITMALTRPDICGFSLGYDDFAADVMVVEQGAAKRRHLKDTDYTKMCLQLERGGFQNISKETIRDAIALIAELNSYDSAKDWVNNLTWDGVPRVEQFLSVYFGAKDGPYTREISRYYWTAQAGRLLQPGVKCDMVPVAVGEQGMRKSSAVAAIVPDAAFYIAIDLGSKDDELARFMRGKMVVELDELKGLGTRDSEHIKSLISRTYEEWIPKYKEMNTRYLRRSVFFGTSNKDDFLADETGNRRWLPFRCGMCDPDAITRDRDQLWAEARGLFNAHGVLHHEAELLAKVEHESFVESDEWDSAVHHWLHSPDTLTGESPWARGFLTSRDVLKEAFQMSDAQQTRQHALRMKKVLIRLGYTYANKRTEHGRQRGFVPPSLFK